jgi:hypothetical protein
MPSKNNKSKTGKNSRAASTGAQLTNKPTAAGTTTDKTMASLTAGHAVSPHSGVRGVSHPSASSSTGPPPNPPVQSVVHPVQPPGTIGIAEELSTIATQPDPGLPSSTTIQQFTNTHIFPRVKFYRKKTNDTLLDWKEDDNSICQFVLRSCNVPTNKRYEYWPIAAQIIHRKLTILRNDRPINVRHAFFGKLYFLFYVQIYILIINPVTFFPEVLTERNCEGKTPLMYKVSTFLQMRKASFFYKMFFNNFVKQIVGCNVYNDRMHDRSRHPDTLCTVSDEAFCLLVIENYYDRMMEIFRVNKNVTPPPKLYKKLSDELGEAFNAKYTLSGNTKGTTKVPGKGWTEDGMKRYNQLYNLVIADRKKYPSFLQELCDKARKKKTEVATMNRKRKHVTLAIHEDFFVEDTEFPQEPYCEEEDGCSISSVNDMDDEHSIDEPNTDDGGNDADENGIDDGEETDQEEEG